MVSLRSGASFPKREADEPPVPRGPAAVVLPTRRRKKPAASASVRKEKTKKKGSSSDAAASRERPAGVAAVEDTDVLDCGVCFLPLKPPIFQCDVGHVACSTCRDKLKAPSQCHVCSGATGGGFRRCHAMERLVDSIRVSCPHSAAGCTAAPAYYDLDVHRQACPYSRCRCPGEACGFAGAMDALLDHFTGVHGWPRATKVSVSVVNSYESYNMCLRDGFNFFLVDRATAGASRECLFLLNVARQPLGRAITVVRIRPHGDCRPSPEKMECELRYSRRTRGQIMEEYSQSSRFRVASTDLSNGLPEPDTCIPFLVLNSVLGDDGGKNWIEVRARIIFD